MPGACNSAYRAAPPINSSSQLTPGVFERVDQHVAQPGSTSCGSSSRPYSDLNSAKSSTTCRCHAELFGLCAGQLAAADRGGRSAVPCCQPSASGWAASLGVGEVIDQPVRIARAAERRSRCGSTMRPANAGERNFCLAMSSSAVAVSRHIVSLRAARRPNRPASPRDASRYDRRPGR